MKKFVCLLTVFAIFVSCSDNSFQGMTVAVKAKIDEATKTLQSVKDKASAEKIKPKLEEYIAYFKEMNAKLKEHDFSAEEKTAELKQAMIDMTNSFNKFGVEYDRLLYQTEDYLDIIGPQVEKLYLQIKK